MEVEPQPDGEAILRVTNGELVSLYNLHNAWIQQAARDTTVKEKWLRAARIRLHQLAVAIGRDDVPHPDDL